jgi:hypothetical protein
MFLSGLELKFESCLLFRKTCLDLWRFIYLCVVPRKANSPHAPYPVMMVVYVPCSLSLHMPRLQQSHILLLRRGWSTYIQLVG